MVIDSDRIVDYTPENIKNILREYPSRKKQEAIFESEDKEIDFINHCLKYLDEGERDILIKIYIEGISIRKYSKMSGFSRHFIDRQIKKSVDLLTKFFNIKFNN